MFRVLYSAENSDSGFCVCRESALTHQAKLLGPFIGMDSVIHQTLCWVLVLKVALVCRTYRFMCSAPVFLA